MEKHLANSLPCNFTYRGHVANCAELPNTAEDNDVYFVSAIDTLYVYTQGYFVVLNVLRSKLYIKDTRGLLLPTNFETLHLIHDLSSYDHTGNKPSITYFEEDVNGHLMEQHFKCTNTCSPDGCTYCACNYVRCTLCGANNYGDEAPLLSEYCGGTKC